MHLDRPAAHAALVRARRSCRAAPASSTRPTATAESTTPRRRHLDPMARQPACGSAGRRPGLGRHAVLHRERRPGRAPQPDQRELAGTATVHRNRDPLPTPVDAGGGAIFLTNAILCFKDGGMQGKVGPEWFANCGARFLRPTIDIVPPKVVVSLGEWAYRATTAAYGIPRIPFRKAVERPEGFRLEDGIFAYPLPLRRADIQHAPADGAATEGLGTGGKGVAVLTVPYVRSRGCSPSRPSTNRYTLRHSVPLHQVIMSPPLCSLPRYTNACVSPIQAISISRPFRR